MTTRRLCSACAGVGLGGGDNPPAITVLHASDMSWITTESAGISIPALKEEAERGWVEFFPGMPMWPYRCNKLSTIEQGGPADGGGKLHHIYDAKRETRPGVMGTNRSRLTIHHAKLRLVKMKEIIAAVAFLVLLARAMIKRGFGVLVAMGWVDLFSAYNQVAQCRSGLWQNAFGVRK